MARTTQKDIQDQWRETSQRTKQKMKTNRDQKTTRFLQLRSPNNKLEVMFSGVHENF